MVGKPDSLGFTRKPPPSTFNYGWDTASIVHFVIDKTKELFNSKNFEAIKKYIGSAAALFGKTLGDVTHKITDVVSDSFDAFRRTSSDAIDRTVDLASDAYVTVKKSAGKVAEHAHRKVKGMKPRALGSTAKNAKVTRNSKKT
ncbi:MAG: hypothetical protein F9K21_13370 [Rhodocyclaceae bacterium]|nr:MAG: hypothetical protein F9K21_13370 [Rhodocyclaceae bacterium]